jgi:hypothetical protein
MDVREPIHHLCEGLVGGMSPGCLRILNVSSGERVSKELLELLLHVICLDCVQLALAAAMNYYVGLSDCQTATLPRCGTASIEDETSTEGTRNPFPHQTSVNESELNRPACMESVTRASGHLPAVSTGKLQFRSLPARSTRPPGHALQLMGRPQQAISWARPSNPN